jgi:NitT/TauT family transport system substrate-binding protein
VTHRAATKKRNVVALCGALVLLSAPSVAQAPDVVEFGINWVPEAEQGGFFQAAANGTYEKYNLKVNFHILGPQGNIDLQIASGAIDVGLVSNSFNSLNAVANDIPLVEIAAFFQKEPRVLIAHPNQGNDTLESLRGKPIMLAKSGVQTFWNFLKARYGYTDDQVRVYTFNTGPFLADPKAVQQGLLTSEPYAIRKAGVDPVVMVLADHGYQSYADPL